MWVWRKCVLREIGARVSCTHVHGCLHVRPSGLVDHHARVAVPAAPLCVRTCARVVLPVTIVQSALRRTQPSKPQLKPVSLSSFATPTPRIIAGLKQTCDRDVVVGRVGVRGLTATGCQHGPAGTSPFDDDQPWPCSVSPPTPAPSPTPSIYALAIAEIISIFIRIPVAGAGRG